MSTAFLLRPLLSLTSSEEAAHKAAQEMQDICTGAWEHTFPSPLAGVVLALSGASGEMN